ncbi:hypothetical protein BTVI_56046 [Pitangus sulphuratus]|nr:hypothetical protein BTVI_56046 [Pitangus sulphuratus]
MGWCKPGCMYRLGNKRLETSTEERDLGILVGILNMGQECALATRRANRVLGCIKHSIASCSREVIVLLCSALMQPHLEYSIQFWSHKKVIKLLESIQRRAMRMVKGLEGKPYEEWLRSLGLFSLEKRRLRGDLIAVYNFLMRRRGGVTSDRTRGNSMKLSQGRFSLDIRKRFFTRRAVGYWNRLSTEVVTASSLTEFKKHLDNSLRHKV